MRFEFTNLCATHATSSPDGSAFAAGRSNHCVGGVADFHQPSVVSCAEITGTIKGFVGGGGEIGWIVESVGIDPPITVAWIKCEVIVLGASSVGRVKLTDCDDCSRAQIAPSGVVGERDNALLNQAIAIPKICSVGDRVQAFGP